MRASPRLRVRVFYWVTDDRRVIAVAVLVKVVP